MKNVLDCICRILAICWKTSTIIKIKNTTNSPQKKDTLISKDELMIAKKNELRSAYHGTKLTI